MSDQTVRKWVIWINGYGSFDFEGTEVEAEEMRVHKSKWERGCGFKYREDLSRESDKLTAKVVETFAAGEGVPQRLFTELKAAREADGFIGL